MRTMGGLDRSTGDLEVTTDALQVDLSELQSVGTSDCPVDHDVPAAEKCIPKRGYKSP